MVAFRFGLVLATSRQAGTTVARLEVPELNV